MLGVTPRRHPLCSLLHRCASCRGTTTAGRAGRRSGGTAAMASSRPRLPPSTRCATQTLFGPEPSTAPNATPARPSSGRGPHRVVVRSRSARASRGRKCMRLSLQREAAPGGSAHLCRCATADHQRRGHPAERGHSGDKHGKIDRGGAPQQSLRARFCKRIRPFSGIAQEEFTISAPNLHLVLASRPKRAVWSRFRSPRSCGRAGLGAQSLLPFLTGMSVSAHFTGEDERWHARPGP